MKNLKLLPFAVFCIREIIDDLYITNLCGWRVSMNVLNISVHFIALIYNNLINYVVIKENRVHE